MTISEMEAAHAEAIKAQIGARDAWRRLARHHMSVGRGAIAERDRLRSDLMDARHELAQLRAIVAVLQEHIAEAQ